MAQAVVDHAELTRRGQEYYNRHLRAELEPEHDGEFLVLDVESGDYEVDSDQLVAMDRAEVRHPDGIFYVLRVGRRTATRIGVKRAGADA